MRLIGLVGGTTWLSTAEYYRHINELVADRLGGLHSARIVLHSVDFADVIACGGRAEDEAAILIDAARSVERGGAQLLALCANTAHVHAAAVAAAVSIPLVHLVDGVAERIREAGSTTVGVLCTHRSRDAAIFDAALSKTADGRVLMPSAAEQTELDQAILDFAHSGGSSRESKLCVQGLVQELCRRGADGIVLGCTELPLMLKGAQSADTAIFDTTYIHAHSIVTHALFEQSRQ